jgi:hypothetical protein
MIDKTLIFIICFLLISPILITNDASSLKFKINNYHNEIVGKGFLEIVDGVTVLHINGSYYEMGYQYGHYLKEECLEFFRAFYDLASKNGFTNEDLEKFWNDIKSYVPQSHIDQLQGLADAINKSFEYVVHGNFIPYQFSRIIDPFKIECCNFASWGPSTSNEMLYHAGSYDLHIWVQDPISKKYVVQENQLLIIRQPDDGFSSIIVTIAGYTGCIGGFNNQGVSVGLNRGFSSDESISGMPIAIKLEEILDRTSSADEALQYFEINGTLGYIVMISDSNAPIAYTVETTSNHTQISKWNDDNESIDPFWSIDHVMRRVNLFITPLISSTQRERYDPRGLLLWAIGKNDLWAHWWHYKRISKEIEKKWGHINGSNSMEIMRNVYRGRSDPFFFFATQLTKILESWHQWTFCPKNGDIWISFAKDGKSAFDNPIHHLNFYDLLD